MCGNVFMMSLEPVKHTGRQPMWMTYLCLNVKKQACHESITGVGRVDSDGPSSGIFPIP